MEIKQIGVTIAQSLNVGGYETIRPTLTITAEVAEEDDIEECFKEIHKEASTHWARQALTELSWVAKRRMRNAEKKHEFNELTEGTRNHLKGML